MNGLGVTYELRVWGERTDIIIAYATTLFGHKRNEHSVQCYIADAAEPLCRVKAMSVSQMLMCCAVYTELHGE